MKLEVHIDWSGQTHFVGVLYPTKGESVSFEYDLGWLTRKGAFSIDPTSLPLQRGQQHSRGLFGAFQDCGPDRWGRILIERAVRKKVLENKPYRDIDYVVALNDITRIGALRFREAGGPFLAADGGTIPPVVELRALLRATEAIHGERETAKELKFLLGAGSPLGGARPKSVVLLPDNQMAIAKFPKPDDVRDVAAGEILALTLAEQAGINTVSHKLVTIGKQPVALITRFDRNGQIRLPFISASSLLGLPHDDPGAYTMIADGIRQFGGNVKKDLEELWRRLIFSLLASNNDDHLRNHGFLMREAGKWSLSPAYDINPVPEMDRARVSKTPITEDREEPSISMALNAAPRFGLKPIEAKEILKNVYLSVLGWEKVARKLRLRSGTIDSYASAFENPFMNEAKSLIGSH